MNSPSPLQGGQMRRSRRGRVAPRRGRFGRRLAVVVLLSLAATGIWLVVGESKTTDSAAPGTPPGPGDRALVTHEALNYSGSGVGVLPRGRFVPVEGLLAGMLLPSGNDAAIALADHVAGHDRDFVRLMNQRARLMGLGCTHYSSSYGLPDTNRSCAVDLAALSRVAMTKPRIARLVRKRQAKVRFPIKTGYLYVNSTNPLLRIHFPGTIGLKTGSTLKAGHCFVGVVRRGLRTIAVVLLHSPNSLVQAEKLVTAAFKLRP